MRRRPAMQFSWEPPASLHVRLGELFLQMHYRSGVNDVYVTREESLVDPFLRDERSVLVDYMRCNVRYASDSALLKPPVFNHELLKPPVFDLYPDAGDCVDDRYPPSLTDELRRLLGPSVSFKTLSPESYTKSLVRRLREKKKGKK